MALSMTGYGRAKELLHGREITIEIKSVNSRYFEYSSRMPRNCGFLEELLKKAVKAGISRGKVEVNMALHNLEQGETEITPNINAARGYRNSLAEISSQLGIVDDTSASVLARFSDVFTVLRTETDEAQLTADVTQVAALAVQRFNAMRAIEGAKLVEDISARLAAISTMVSTVQATSSERVSRYSERLYKRLQEVLQDTAIEESRILTEAAIFADKTAVDEETVRLQSHLAQFGEILAAPGATGRKLDFLTQEVNREVNTIGSKCQELDITKIVVDMKAEIEKIREQIQNIE